MDLADIKKRIKKITIIWIALLLELGLAFCISYFVLAPENLQPENNLIHHYFLYFAYLSVLAAIPGGYYFYTNKIKQNRSYFSVKEKYKIYFTAVIIKYVIFEFAGIISLVAFLVTEQTEPLYMFAITIIAVLINMPSSFRFKKDFDIRDKKAESLYTAEENNQLPKATEENNSNG